VKVKACTLKNFKHFQRAKNRDIIFFRLGYLNYMKLNEKNMVQKFKKDEWYDVDLILNWELEKVSIYVNGVPKDATADFFINEKRKKN